MISCAISIKPSSTIEFCTKALYSSVWEEVALKIQEQLNAADRIRIVAESLNDLLLKWKGIKATEKLATSPNAKACPEPANKRIEV